MFQWNNLIIQSQVFLPYFQIHSVQTLRFISTCGQHNRVRKQANERDIQFLHLFFL